MATYLGRIRIQETSYRRFVNLELEYVLENGELRELDRYEKMELLPESELTNVLLEFAGDERDDRREEEFFDGAYWFLDFTTGDLVANVNPGTGQRYRTGWKLRMPTVGSALRPIWEEGFYPILFSSDVTADYRASSILPVVSGTDVFEGEMCVLDVLDDRSDVLGPFELGLRAHDGALYVNTKASSSGYVLPVQHFANGKDQHVVRLGTSRMAYLRLRGGEGEERYVDSISDEALLQGFRDAVADGLTEDGKLDLRDFEAVLGAFKSSELIGDGVPEEIAAGRLERVKKLISRFEGLDDALSGLGAALAALLARSADSPEAEPLLRALAENGRFMEQVPRFRYISGKLEEKEGELHRLTEQLDALERRRENEQAELEEKLQAACEDLQGERRAEIDALEGRIAALREELSLLGEVRDVRARLDALRGEVDYKEKRERELDAKLRVVEERLDDILDGASRRAMELSFDGMLAARLQRAAAEWEEQRRDRDYAAAARFLQGFPRTAPEREALADELCRRVGVYRPAYGRNAILNLFICLTQGFLTVFSGSPGTGKTSACAILANVLGLTLPGRTPEAEAGLCVGRYVPVSVERGWTSKRDFIGYYNPLSRQFSRSNGALFDALNVLDLEARGQATDLPFLVLLDEANLSQMEYYWADFMNACDDFAGRGSVELGEGCSFRIPDCLRFVATINNDHTVEELSLRLIDRAWVVTLPSVKPGTFAAPALSDEGVEAVAWSALRRAFGGDGAAAIAGPAREIYEGVCAQLKAVNVGVSSRADNAVRRYWAVAQGVFCDEPDRDSDAGAVAIDYAIAQRILPHVSGSGEDFGAALEKLAKFCEDKSLRLTAERLREMLRRGRQSMDYYRFFG